MDYKDVCEYLCPVPDKKGYKRGFFRLRNKIAQKYLDDVLWKAQRFMAAIDHCKHMGRKNHGPLVKTGLTAITDKLRRQIQSLQYNAVQKVSWKVLAPLVK